MFDPGWIEFEFWKVDPFGQPIARSQGATKLWAESLGEGVLLELVEIPAGDFPMGAPESEEGWHPSQAPLHRVEVSHFWMGRYPVTQAQWQAIAGLPVVNRPLNPLPSCFEGKNRPVEQVSWWDAMEFCDRLNRFVEARRSAMIGSIYRLPTEAEWEYACRGGSQTPFHFGETITTDLANYSGVDWEYNGRICSKGSYGKGSTGSDRRETTEVGSFQVANPYGLYDMHGLVREWCLDCWHDSYTGAPTNGAAWEKESGQERVLRGGSWNGGPRVCRSAFRGKFAPEDSLYDVGFRVVCQTDTPAPYP